MNSYHFSVAEGNDFHREHPVTKHKLSIRINPIPVQYCFTNGAVDGRVRQFIKV
jgi:hypothetical protein